MHGEIDDVPVQIGPDRQLRPARDPVRMDVLLSSKRQPGRFVFSSLFPFYAASLEAGLSLRRAPFENRIALIVIEMYASLGLGRDGAVGIIPP